MSAAAMIARAAGAVVLTIAAGCASEHPAAGAEATPPIAGADSAAAPEAVSLLGVPLYPMELPGDVRAERERLLAAALAEYERDPGSEDAVIWYGRRLAYLGRYREAIDVYTEGLRAHPQSVRLLRHRGHRYITVRQLDDAIADLDRAAALCEGTPDRVEPDGLPNRAGLPTSTTQTNVFYHLGLAHYLEGEYDAALDAYRRCFALSRNDDMRCATAYWLYLTQRRLGRVTEARETLEPIRPDLEIVENFAYHRLLLMFKGELAPDEVFDHEESPVGGAIDDATSAYGVGMWHLLHGDRPAAQRIFERITAGPAWPAFGYIAAEADVAGR